MYAGSILKRGDIEADVIATGQKTYFGKTAQLVASGGSPARRSPSMPGPGARRAATSRESGRTAGPAGAPRAPAPVARADGIATQ